MTPSPGDERPVGARDAPPVVVGAVDPEGHEHDDAHRVRMVVAWRRSVRREAGAAPRRLPLDGGMVGAAFFGCLVAAGLTWLLITVFAGLSVALGLDTAVARSAGAAGATGAVEAMTRSTLIGSVVVAHVAGGFAAARMSGSGGVVLGFVVWVWMQAVALVVVSLGAVTNAAGGLPAATTHRAEGLVDWNLGAVGPLMIIAMAVAALVGSMSGAALGDASSRRSRAPYVDPADDPA